MTEHKMILIPEGVRYGQDSQNQCMAGSMLYRMSALFSNSIAEKRLIFNPLLELSSKMSFEMVSPANAAFLLRVYSDWKSGRQIDVADRVLALADYVHVFYGYVLRSVVHISSGESDKGNKCCLCCSLYLSSLTGDGVSEDEEMIYLVRIPVVRLLFWMDKFVFSTPGIDSESIIGSLVGGKEDDIKVFLDHIYLKNYLASFFDCLFKSSLADNPCLSNILFNKISVYIANRVDLITQSQNVSELSKEENENGETKVMVLDCEKLYEKQ